MSDQFLDGFRATASQWMVLDCITRVLREHFDFQISRLPCITFAEAEAHDCKAIRYIGKGNFRSTDMAADIQFGISWERRRDEDFHLYLNNFFVAALYNGCVNAKKFWLGDGDIAEVRFEPGELPVELKELRAPRRARLLR